MLNVFLSARLAVVVFALGFVTQVAGFTMLAFTGDVLAIAVVLGGHFVMLWAVRQYVDARFRQVYFGSN